VQARCRTGRSEGDVFEIPPHPLDDILPCSTTLKILVCMCYVQTLALYLDALRPGLLPLMGQ